MTVTKLRVKETFIANMIATRRREQFAPGELIVLIEGSDAPTESRFIRLNGLRRSRLECRYSIESSELTKKTEICV